ncbi:DEAD/DEAH box helicase [Alkalihalobacillus deserti]|uniref:DEAD/DEAH box helicase n=1 Tax=Alkalihalobacillus deserti TaxID=2879466 RepID=UPI001D14CBF3|nr:DEAD/DEAH box helicase [Alkalihalobacillus deserti]
MFDLFKRKTRKEVSITTVTTPTPEGLKVLVKKGEELLSIPFQLSATEYRAASSQLLQLLEELWYDELLKEQGHSYILPFELIYELAPEEKQLLDLPPEPALLNMELDNKSFVGSKQFSFTPKYSYQDFWQLEKVGKRNGPIIQLPTKQRILIDRDQYHLLTLIDAQPDPRNQDELFSYIAEVKKKATDLGVKLNTHIEKENYHFVNELGYEIQQDADVIDILPQLKDDELDSNVLKELSNRQSGYIQHEGTRVFVDGSVKKQANMLQNLEPISGSNIPKFIENPEAFLPEQLEISIEQFSERVRNLGIRVYKAQPFVHARNKERGWFELETGFHVSDEEGERKGELATESIKDLIEEATEKGEEYLQWEGQWLRIPNDASEFVSASEKLQTELQDDKSIDYSKLPYVLEIFENVNQLEYNAPILEIQQSLRDLNVFDKQPPAIFKATLKPFQEDGFIWMKSLHFRKVGGLLADDMGLGKTIQVIAFLSYLKEIDKLGPSLIVVPKTLMENWQKEIMKFAPSMVGSIYFHRGTERVKKVEIIKQQTIVITTYQTLVRDQLTLGQVDWSAVICDEAQAMKNPTTAVSKVIKALKSTFRLAMTGTPVENSLTELWSIVDFVQPGMLGSLKEFKDAYIKPLEEENIAPLEIEEKLTQQLMMNYKRRTKQKELKGQLPAKHNHPIEVLLGKKQEELYLNIIGLVKEKVIPPIKAIGQLKMLSSHPGLINEEYLNLPLKAVPKLAQTISLIKEIQAKNEKVLIFTEYKQMQVILKRYILEELNVNAAIINGETSRRQLVVDHFNQKPGFDVMILSPKAAGTGLTITSANHVIHYTRWWNPAVENQSTDRVYRIGQEKEVHVYYPIVKSSGKLDTVEEIVQRIIHDKQELANSVIVPSKKLDIEKEILEAGVVS